MVYNFKVFKKCAPNGKLTLYMGKRDFVDYISAVEPIGKIIFYYVKFERKKKQILNTKFIFIFHRWRFIVGSGIHERTKSLRTSDMFFPIWKRRR